MGNLLKEAGIRDDEAEVNVDWGVNARLELEIAELDSGYVVELQNQ